MTCMYFYRKGSKGTENYERVKKDIETLLTSGERITDEHKWFIDAFDDHCTYFHFFTIPQLKKRCLEDPNDEKRLNLFLNETEYFKWWDREYNGGTGIYNKYHFYYDTIGNGNINKFDPFYDPVLSMGGGKDGPQSTICFGGFTKKEIMNDYDTIGNGNINKFNPFYDPILSMGGGKDGPQSTICFGGFTKKEIMNDYFIRDGKGYGLLDIIKKFYGVNRYKEIHNDMMNFAENQMIYLEEDISNEAKEIRQKKLEALASDTLDAIQKLADKIKER